MRGTPVRALALAALLATAPGVGSPVPPTAQPSLPSVGPAAPLLGGATEVGRPRADLPRRVTPHADERPRVHADPAPRRLRATTDGGRLLVRVERDLQVRARPGAGPVIGVLPSRSRYYGQPIVAWVGEVSRDGRFGRVSIPYVSRHRSGWIPLRGLERSRVSVLVRVDLSRHWVSVMRGKRIAFGLPGGTGASSSPTPAGRYFVTDRVAFPGGGSFGTFAFGISGIQPNLPAGWTGGNQLAIHGTSDPSSIGRSASAGCVRVSERALDRLRGLLRPGTPVVIVE